MATYDYYVSRRDTAGEAVRAIRWDNNEKDTNDLVNFLNSTKVKVLEKRVNAQSLTLKLSNGTNLNIPAGSFLLLNKTGMVASQPDEVFRESFIRKSEVGDRAGQPIPYTRKKGSVSKESNEDSAERNKEAFIKKAKGILEVSGLAPYNNITQRFQENRMPNLDPNSPIEQGISHVISEAVLYTQKFGQSMGIPGEVIPTEILERMIALGAIGLWPKVRNSLPEENRSFGKAMWVSRLAEYARIVRVEGNKGSSRQISVGMGGSNPASPGGRSSKSKNSSGKSDSSFKESDSLIEKIEQETGDKVSIVKAFKKSWVINDTGRVKQVLCLGEVKIGKVPLVYDEPAKGFEQVSQLGEPFWVDVQGSVLGDNMVKLLKSIPDIAVISHLEIASDVDDYGRTVRFSQEEHKKAFLSMVSGVLSRTINMGTPKSGDSGESGKATQEVIGIWDIEEY